MIIDNNYSKLGDILSVTVFFSSMLIYVVCFFIVIVLYVANKKNGGIFAILFYILSVPLLVISIMGGFQIYIDVLIMLISASGSLILVNIK